MIIPSQEPMSDYIEPSEKKFAYFGRFNSQYEAKTITKAKHGVPDLTEVAFLLPYRDWCELQNSDCWHQVLEFLAQKESTNSRTPHTGEQGIMEELQK